MLDIDIPLVPLECPVCGVMVGSRCWEKWKVNKRECPLCRKSGDCVDSFFYQDYVNGLQVLCDCGEQIMLRNFKQHSVECSALNKKCASNSCQSAADSNIEVQLKSGKRQVCSQFCKFTSRIQDAVRPFIQRDFRPVVKDINSILEKFFNKVSRHVIPPEIAESAIKVSAVEPPVIIAKKEIPISINGVCDFNFVNITPTDIKIEGKKCILNENLYVFRTVISDRVFAYTAVYTAWDLLLGNSG